VTRVWRRLPFPHVLAAGLCAGLACANLVRAGAVALALFCLAVAGALLAPARARLALVVAALAAGGWWLGSARLDALDRSVLVAEVGRTAPARVVVTGPARRGGFALRVPADVVRFGRIELRERVLLQLPLGRAPPQGAILGLVGTIERPRPEERGFDEAAWLRRQGVQVVVEGGRWRLAGRRGGLAGLADRLRARIARGVGAGVDGERRAVLLGVVLGEDEGLSDELRDAFRASGLYHLLAVSGQNVGLLVGGIIGLGWIAGVPRRYAQITALAAIGGYVLAVGWQPSVVRAGVAGALASLAWLAARPVDRWYFLLLGAAVLLAWNPYSLLEPGFQLSFTAVAAIFLLVPALQRRLEGYPLPGHAADAAAVSAACTVATAPLLWLHFGSLPVIGLVSNVVAAPAMGALLGLGLGAAAIEPVAPPVAAAVSWLDGWLAAYVAASARLFGGLPFAQVTSGRVLGAGLGVLAVALLLARVRRRRDRLLVGLAAGVVAAALGFQALPTHVPPPHGLRITFLDVGQGDAVLIQVPQGAILVDQGPPEGRAAAQLRALGVHRLAALVLTHPQRDHVGGAAEVIRSVAVDLVLDPRLLVRGADGAAAHAAARARGVPVRTARAGLAFALGRLRVRVLWPADAGGAAEDPNLNAIVLLVSYGSVDALLTADAESEVTLPLRPPPVEILKVAHHGSADELLPRLLDRLRPRVAVISVGERNDYGHPTPTTLAALGGVPGLALYRTDVDGRVTIESDGERIEARGED
jgi:competence protein ComEC